MVTGRVREPGRADPATTIGNAALAIGALLPALGLTSCFDVQTVEPGPGTFAIADFEQGDAVPNTELFDRFFCYTFNPDLGQDPEQAVTCGIENHPGDQSQFALVATFMLHNGMPVPQYAGAGLSTIADTAAVDFNRYQDLVFMMRVEITEPLPPMAMVDVQLGCNSVAAQDANSNQEYFDLYHAVAATSQWSQFRISLATFTQRQDEMNLFKGGPKACLALVDSVRFEVVRQLTQGQSASGSIHVDSIRLENPVR